MAENSEADNMIIFKFFKIDPETKKQADDQFYGIQAEKIDGLEVGAIIENIDRKDGVYFHYLIVSMEKKYEEVRIYGTLHPVINLRGLPK